MFRWAYLTSRQRDLWSLRLGGLTESEISRKEEISRQSVHIILNVAVEKISDALREVAEVNRIKVEHIDVMKSKVLGKRRRARLGAGRLRFQELSGELCIVKHYLSIRAEDFVKAEIRAIILSGNFADWSQYDLGEFGELFKLIDSYGTPTLGLCGGHQLLAQMYGVRVGPMRALKPGEIGP